MGPVMTTTNKPVRRVTQGSYAVLYAKARPIIVSILPGDVLEFREHGRRGRWYLAIDSAFRQAVRIQALHDAAQKKRERKARAGK
jgi:hypothetical protein